MVNANIVNLQCLNVYIRSDNIVRFTFSVGDTTWVVYNFGVEQDKWELVTLDTSGRHKWWCII